MDVEPASSAVVSRPAVALDRMYKKLLTSTAIAEPPRSLSPRVPDLLPITVVTAASENHARTTRQLCAAVLLVRADSTDESVRRHLPDVRFIVYDLGFSEATRRNMSYTSVWPSIELRPFAFDRHPAWFDINVRRGEYGWKPALLTDVLRETGGLVVWLDAGDMLWRRPVEVLRATAISGAYSTWCVL